MCARAFIPSFQSHMGPPKSAPTSKEPERWILHQQNSVSGPRATAPRGDPATAAALAYTRLAEAKGRIGRAPRRKTKGRHPAM